MEVRRTETNDTNVALYAFEEAKRHNYRAVVVFMPNNLEEVKGEIVNISCKFHKFEAQCIWGLRGCCALMPCTAREERRR